MTLLKQISLERSVVIVSHDVKLARNYGDRVIEISDGNVVRDIARENYEDNYVEKENSFY